MPKSATAPRSRAARPRPRSAADVQAARARAEALQDARDCVAFEAYVGALLTAPVESLVPAQRHQRAEVERVMPPDPEADAVLARRRAAGRTRAPAWPSPVVLAHLVAWLREMALENEAGPAPLVSCPSAG